jgi:hypothetical protein
MSQKTCYTIVEFCREHGNISRPMLYKLWEAGKGPRRMEVGRRILITDEAAAEWRQRMERESNPAPRCSTSGREVAA